MTMIRPKIKGLPMTDPPKEKKKKTQTKESKNEGVRGKIDIVSMVK